MDLKEIDILGDSLAKHWYYRSKARAMTHMLDSANPSVVLDVGAGSGYFARCLLNSSNANEAWCVDTLYDGDSDSLVEGKPIHFRRSIDRVDADLVLMMDVLEHVDNDLGLLEEYAAKVPGGCRFLISVPAFKSLWSGHDLFLEHKRRYRLRQIEKVVEDAGLTVKHGAYYFGAVFPIAATTRLLEKLLHGDTLTPQSQLKRHHPMVNGALEFLCYAELPLMMYNRFVGLSAFCLAESG